MVIKLWIQYVVCFFTIDRKWVLRKVWYLIPLKQFLFHFFLFISVLRWIYNSENEKIIMYKYLHVSSINCKLSYCPIFLFVWATFTDRTKYILFGLVFFRTIMMTTLIVYYHCDWFCRFRMILIFYRYLILLL